MFLPTPSGHLKENPPDRETDRKKKKKIGRVCDSVEGVMERSDGCVCGGERRRENVVKYLFHRVEGESEGSVKCWMTSVMITPPPSAN